MSGRPGPRPLAAAVEAIVAAAAPATLLADVQAAWPEAAGRIVSEEAEPVAERDGIVTFECSSSVWANELELLSPDLHERLAGRLTDGSRLRGLRFTARRR